MFSSIATLFAQANQYFNTQLSHHFHALESGSIAPMALIFALAFGYGVVHALGPGHGKALVAGYLLANPTKRSHIFQIGFMIAVVHTISALSVTLFAAYMINVSANRLFRDVNGPLFQISGGLILIMGCWLLYEVWQSRRIRTETLKPHKSRFGVVVSAGIVPCPGVITLSFFAITLGQITVGMVASVFMSLGMGLSISLAGLAAYALQKSRKITTQPKWFWVLRLIGVCCVIILGLWLIFNPHVHPQRAF